MRKWFIIIAFFLSILSGSFSLVAGECPEIEGSLRFALYKNFPSYEIVMVDAFAEQQQQGGDTFNADQCSYIVEVAPSAYVLLLKAKKSSEYLAVLALSPELNKSEEWMVEKLDTYKDDVPVLRKARSGFYSDINTRKKLTVTRDSSAALVQCLDSGNQYIYKILHGGGFSRCRVK